MAGDRTQASGPGGVGQIALQVKRSVTWRSLLLGLLATLLCNTLSVYSECHGSGNFSWTYMPEGGIIPFLIVAAINGLVRLVAPRAALNNGEMLVVFIMGLISNSTSIFLMFMQLAAIAAPQYFASPENKWGELLIPHMPEQLILTDTLAAKYVHQGLPVGAPIPWGPWVEPLAHWVPFILLMLAAGYALVSLLSRQWQDNEKLSYPLMQLPLVLVGEGPRPGKRALAASPLFWIGFLIAVATITYSGFSILYPAMPKLPMDVNGVVRLGTLQATGAMPTFYFWFNFLMVGLGWFVPLEILFSIWFFNLFRLAQVWMLNILGLSLGPSGFFMWGMDAISCWQGGGAFLVLALASMYTGRQHLRRTFHVALGAIRDTADEMLPARVAWGLVICGSLGMLVWLVNYNMPLTAAALLVLSVMTIYVAISRVLCEAGVYYFTPPLIAQNFVIYALGSRNIGREGMAALALSYSWHGDVQTVLPGLAAQTFALKKSTGMRGLQFSGIVWLAVLVGMATVIWFTLFTAYREGGESWKTWAFVTWGPQTYGQVLGQMEMPFGASRAHLGVFAAGALFMTFLTWARLRLNWFPFHPIGYAITASFTIQYVVAFSCFLVWMIKGVMLRYFGVHAFRMAVPFFLGLASGSYMGKLIAVIIVTIFGKVLA